MYGVNKAALSEINFFVFLIFIIIRLYKHSNKMCLQTLSSFVCDVQKYGDTFQSVCFPTIVLHYSFDAHIQKLLCSFLKKTFGEVIFYHNDENEVIMSFSKD